MKEYGLYINGRWTDAAGGHTFQSINPATGEILAVFAMLFALRECRRASDSALSKVRSKVLGLHP
jgi:acyl-CoA reductase-like NAD-dependent aldehyde dehydrogenase